MKKSILFFAVTCLMCVSSFAQNKTTAPAANEGGFILKGGVNLANISISPNGLVDEAKQLTSFNAGFAFDLPLAAGLSLQPGLLFTGKGSKTQQGQETSTFYYRATTNPKYIELPLNLVGKIPLGGSTSLMIGAGPYGAVGVGGKNKIDRKISGVRYEVNNEIEYSNDDPLTAQEEGAGYGKLKRFDYGVNGLAGLEFGKVSLSANYGLGFAKLNSGTNNRDNDNNKHRVLSINLGLKL
jgi:hypothetical protein